MTDQIFPYANIIAGILIFIVGFIFHWVGQLITLINWDFAAKIGLAEMNMIPEFKVYENAIAAADVMIGWIYGIAAAGLILDAQWAYKLAWFPAVIMVYHSLSFWFWVGNQNKSGHPIHSNSFRIGWFLANFVTGVLAILVAWR
ncbi:hypothetical protein ACSAZK_02960 [Methanosarcina sp. Mfa9]|uniref:hypothetical protein n=1 Tax=Methanosarcina sp. Mfa9 TaxID=3439063 RepID=UPI003F83AE21